MLEEFLRKRRHSIVREWRARVRELPVERRLSERELVSRVSEILDQIGRVVGPEGPSGGPRRPHESHAVERLSAGFDLDQVVNEYAVLRRCILDLWEREHPVRLRSSDMQNLHAAIDRSIGEAAACYAAALERRATPSEPPTLDRDISIRSLALAAESTERRRSVEGQRFLATARAKLAESLDTETTLATIAQLAVPMFAELASVHLLGSDGRIRAVELALANPEQAALARMLKEVPIDPEVPVGLPRVLRTGLPEWASSVTEEWITPFARDDDHLRLLQALDVGSYIVVPLVARGRTLGALGFSVGRSARPYDASDFTLAQELARTAAFAVDNARLYEEAQQAVRLRDHVLAVVTHDLRTPLSTIRTATALLTRALPPPLRPSVERIQRAGHRMERLISDLGDMVSIQAGRLAVNLRTEDPAELVQAAIDEHTAAAREASVALVSRIATAGARIDGDRDRILQVFGNLIGNALRFTGPGGTITVGAELDGSDVRFSVSDTGSGIADADRASLFEAYVSAGGASKQSTGLGLFIARGIVEGHKGRIWLDAEATSGASFSFTVPWIR